METLKRRNHFLSGERHVDRMSDGCGFVGAVVARPFPQFIRIDHQILANNPPHASPTHSLLALYTSVPALAEADPRIGASQTCTDLVVWDWPNPGWAIAVGRAEGEDEQLPIRGLLHVPVFGSQPDPPMELLELLTAFVATGDGEAAQLVSAAW
jgi:hypothetical protein